MSTLPRDGLRLIETAGVLLFTTLAATVAAELAARFAVFALGLEAAGPLAPGAVARAACLASLAASGAWWLFAHVSRRPFLPFVSFAAWTGALSLLATLWRRDVLGDPAEAGVLVALHVLVLAIVVPPYLRLSRE